MGLIDPRESEEAFEALYELILAAIKPLLPSNKRAFNFADQDYARRSQETTRKFAEKLKYSPPPRNLVFLHRKMAGLYAALKSLKVSLKVAPYWDLMAKKS
jgi:aarF domain-containing kinase